MWQTGSVVVGTISSVRPTNISEFVPLDVIAPARDLPGHARGTDACTGELLLGIEIAIGRPDYVGGNVVTTSDGAVVVGVPVSFFDFFEAPPLVDDHYVRWPEAEIHGALVPGMPVALWVLPDPNYGLNYVTGWFWEYDVGTEEVILGPGAYCSSTASDTRVPLAELRSEDGFPSGRDADDYIDVALLKRYGMAVCLDMPEAGGACVISWEGDEVLDPCLPQEYCSREGRCVAPVPCGGGCPAGRTCGANGLCAPCPEGDLNCVYYNEDGTRRSR